MRSPASRRAPAALGAARVSLGAQRSTRVVALFAALLTLAAAPPARAACPEERELPRLSNVELVEAAGAIVLARPIDFRERDGRGYAIFRVEATLKGVVGLPYVTLPGLRAFQGRSAPDFAEVRPGARAGSCTALDYRENFPYVLVLERRAGRWQLLRAQAARVNEEVDGPDAPWVQAVQRYVEALGGSRPRGEALATLLTHAKAQHDPFWQRLAADLLAHAKLPTGRKSWPELRALSRVKGFDRDAVLWAFAQGGHPEARPLVKQLLDEGDPSIDLSPLVRYVGRTKDRSQLGRLTALVDDPTRRGDRAQIWAAILAAATAEDAGLLTELAARAPAELLPRFAAWAASNGAQRPMLAALQARGGGERIAVARARLGDPVPIEWAEGAVTAAGPDRAAAVTILATASDDRAQQRLVQLLKRGGEVPSLVLRALADPTVPERVRRIELVLDAGRAAPDERRQVRSLLEECEEAACAPLLARLDAGLEEVRP